MESFFKAGEKIICIDSGGRANGFLVEGKTYTALRVAPCEFCNIPIVGVGVEGGDILDRWHQNRFVNQHEEHQLDNEIHECLKGIKIYNP